MTPILRHGLAAVALLLATHAHAADQGAASKAQLDAWRRAVRVTGSVHNATRDGVKVRPGAASRSSYPGLNAYNARRERR